MERLRAVIGHMHCPTEPYWPGREPWENHPCDRCGSVLSPVVIARSRSIRRSGVVPVEKNHYARHNSVNHRRNTDESGHCGEHRKGAGRDKRSRKQAEASKEGNPTSSAPLPRVVAGRPLHGMKIAIRLSVCARGLYEQSSRHVTTLSRRENAPIGIGGPRDGRVVQTNGRS